MSEQEFLKAGVSAIKSGDRTRAASILAKLVREYPQSERGWYLLGMCVPTAEQRQYCFQQVLSINPNNPDVKKQLALPSAPQPLKKTEEESSPEPLSETPIIPAPERVLTPDTDLLSSFQPVSPFTLYEEEVVEEQIFPEKETEQPPVEKKKKNRRILFVSIAAGVAILIFASYTIITLLNGSLEQALLPATTQSQTSFTSSTQLPTPLPTVAYTPLFEEAPCAFEIPAEATVTCGYAIVPENRTLNPSKTIRLAVTVFHSTSSSPTLDPVIFLRGGPGGQAVQLSAEAYNTLVKPFVSKRDYITFDQRGTGLSTPSLQCDELDKMYRQDIYGMLDPQSREYIFKNALFSCNGLLQINGVDLSAYSTVESAADLRDIVHLLGYEKVNLYGISYGTRLALVTMRNYPEIVRSAILDSVVPAETNLLHEYPASVDSALSKLFASCKANPGCNEAYPNLENVFWDEVNELDAHPFTLSTSAYPIGTVTETVDGYYLLSVILELEKNAFLINTVPQTIYRVKRGDLSTLTAAQYSLPYAFDGINTGLYISMMCREHVLATTEDELRTTSGRVDVNGITWRPFYGNFGDMFEACKSWGVVGPDLGEKDAVVSDIPSLVIEGAYDPATPPFLGKQVAENLSNSFYFEFPNMGHAPTTSDNSGCAMQIAVDFLNKPIAEPDRTCLNKTQGVNFLVPYTGDPAIELKQQTNFWITVDAPQDWYYDEGFFVRYSSPFDVTQVGAFSTSTSVQDIKSYFSSSAYGYRSLDNAPLETGRRNVNGHDWKLYFSTSNGHPVDLAIADLGNSSLIIIMFSHMDEHNALYRTVFLPMVDSAR